MNKAQRLLELTEEELSAADVKHLKKAKLRLKALEDEYHDVDDPIKKDDVKRRINNLKSYIRSYRNPKLRRLIKTP